MEKRMLTPAEICDYVTDVGITKANLTVFKTFVLGILGGAFIALGGFASTMASHSVESYGISKLVAGLVFPLGLIMVVICGAELFTGNTLISVAVYEKKVDILSMLKNWTIVYTGNFIGAFIIALLVFNSGSLDLNSGKLGAAVLKTASYKGGLSFTAGISSGILCNILVCLGVWGSYASKDITGKVFSILFPVMAFVTSGFEHSIANMYYFSVGILAKSNNIFVNASGLSADKLAHISWNNAIFNNLIPVTLGNIIGGAVFVGLSYWAVYKYKHAAVNKEKQEPVNRFETLKAVNQ